MNVNKSLVQITVTLVLILFHINANAQSSIQFQKLSFAEAKAKAKKENKLIFLDGYTSWCAPCKWMEGNVFNQAAVADYYNTNFINTKFDCEVGEGIEIAKKYNIRSFPTYLFLDSGGVLVYRTQSRMEMDEFLKEGQQANNKDFHIPTLQARYAAGERDPAFLLRHIEVMKNVDPKESQSARAAVDEHAKNEDFMKSEIGWKAIMQLGRTGTDPYGSYFLKNKAYFKEHVPAAEFLAKEQQLLRFAMYGYIRDKNKEEFQKGLQYFTSNPDQEAQIEGAMYEVEWVASHGTDDDFIQLTDKLRKGLLKDQAERLSFIARRNSGKYATGSTPTDARVLQCYVLAKQAVELEEDSYSNQGTLAEICILLNKKQEAIKAAEAARALAEFETSKIIKIADKLVERAKSI